MQSIEAYQFRNLKSESVSCCPYLNVIVGGNGEGKTNFLEAITTLGNLRSFRTSHVRRLVLHGATAFRISGNVLRGEKCHYIQHIVEFTPSLKRQLTIDGVDVDIAHYLSFFPVFALGSFDRELVVGSPEVRRAFIDRGIFLLDSHYLNEIRTYRRALSQRNAALNGSADGDEMVLWEKQLAHSGSTMIDRRIHEVESLKAAFAKVFSDLRSSGFPEIEITYKGESWIEKVITCQNRVLELENLYCQRYNDLRVRDRRAGFTFEGPHRHDVVLRADARPLRDVLSSGQIKIVAAALRLASLSVVESARREILPVIIDDVDAELDTESLSRLVGSLGSQRQAFISSTHQLLGVNALNHSEKSTCSFIKMKEGTFEQSLREDL